jgi:hypothetical protein
MHSAATALLSPQRPRLPCNRCRRLDRNLQPLIGVAIRLPEIHGRTFDPPPFAQTVITIWQNVSKYVPMVSGGYGQEPCRHPAELVG